MKLLVCVRQNADGEVNPFDASAYETALRLPGAEITLLSMGPPRTADCLERLTRLGASRAILLTDPALAGSDTLATAYALSCAVSRLVREAGMPDGILCGRQSVDGDTGQVGPMLARMLGLPLVPLVLELSPAPGGGFTAVTRTGSQSVPAPALFTMERSQLLRLPSIRSRAIPPEVWNLAAIGADPARCGLSGSPTRVLATFASDAGQRKCEKIPPEAFARVLAEALRHPASASMCPAAPDTRAPDTGALLPLAYLVGSSALPLAKTVAREVRMLPEDTPEAIAAWAARERPAVLLFAADGYGRAVAPQVAALLGTGLCADCTALAAEDGRMSVYRPAKSGSVLAKIRILTDPQMATLRVSAPPSDGVLLSCGAGVAGSFPALSAYAAAQGYALGASRALVDRGIAPYPLQIGLSGRTVAPRVYLAVGISGAVQHTCAIERAGTVIAVNPDPDARIFSYADYGIVAPAGAVFPLS